MPWDKPSEELIDLLEQSVAHLDCEQKKIFGCPSFLVNNNPFCLVHQSTIVFRLSPADRETLTGEYDEACNFEPMKGRPMKEYFVIPSAIYDDTNLFQDWIRRAYTYAASLPVKTPKKKKR